MGKYNDARRVAGVQCVVRIHHMDLLGGAFALRADYGGMANTTTGLTFDIGDVATRKRGGRRGCLRLMRVFSTARTDSGSGVTARRSSGICQTTILGEYEGFTCFLLGLHRGGRLRITLLWARGGDCPAIQEQEILVRGLGVEVIPIPVLIFQVSTKGAEMIAIGTADHEGHEVLL